MKKLLLAALYVAKDFDEFKARVVPALEESIADDAVMKARVEKLRAMLIGIDPASLVGFVQNHNDDDFLTSCQKIAADIESGAIEKEMCRLMCQSVIRSRHSWVWLIGGFPDASQEARTQGLEIIFAAVRSTHPELQESL